MCNKRNSRRVKLKNGKKIRVDKCLVGLIKFVDSHPFYESVSCCCGHGERQPTVVIKDKNPNYLDIQYMELFSCFIFEHRKRQFYKLDKDGYYYIPELDNIDLTKAAKQQKQLLINLREKY